MNPPRTLQEFKAIIRGEIAHTTPAMLVSVMKSTQNGCLLSVTNLILKTE